MNGKRGSMLLCLGDLPAQVTRKELKRFVQEVVDSMSGSRSFRITPNVAQCSIIRVTDTVSGQAVHQGLITIQPAKIALEAITALRETSFRGCRLDVRRYRHCSFPLPDASAVAGISDLLCVDAHGHLDGAGDAAAAVRIELVSSTGGPARQPLRPAPSSAETGVERPARAGAFAH